MNKTCKSVLVMGALGMSCLVLSWLAQKKEHNIVDEDGNIVASVEEPATKDTSVEVLGYDMPGANYAKEQNIHTYGETVISRDIAYTIAQVMLADTLEDSDGYYAQRGSVQEDLERFTISMTDYVIYEEEVRYLRVLLDVENKSQADKGYSISFFKGVNLREDKLVRYTSSVTDWRVWDESREEISCKDMFRLQAGKSCQIEFVFVIGPAEIYDMYLLLGEDGIGSVSNQFLSLGLDLHETNGFIFITDKNAPSTMEQRDMAQLKIEHVTNKELAECQKESTPVLDRYFHNQDEKFGSIEDVDYGNAVEIWPSWISEVKEVRLADTIEELPESFQNRSYLKDMTEVYQEKFGYEKSELSYLLVTIEMEMKMDVYEANIQYHTSQMMWLYNRDEENRLWRIGYPDDYEICTAGSDTGEHKDLFVYRDGEVYTMTAVYVIWPGALEDVYLWETDSVVQGEGCLTYCEESANMEESAGGVKLEISNLQF